MTPIQTSKMTNFRWVICGLLFMATTINYQDRPIDTDILLYDDLIVDEPDLKIPHPLMQQRDFVMIPLNEIKD